jgi:SpoVK/Ycf46/Vps4 family AAA+-type ATPase
MIWRFTPPTTQNVIRLAGVPDVAEHKQAVLRGRLQRDISEFMREAGLQSLDIRVSCGPASSKVRSSSADEPSNSRIEQFIPVDPDKAKHDWIIPAATRAEIEIIKGLVRDQHFLEEEWGLDLRPVVAFTGPPGVGKTMGARVLARELGKSIIETSYSALESKHPGEGAANVRALFQAATMSGAVLLLDEADNALGRRITVTHGAEQAINSIKTMLLLCLGKHRGLVICATNKVVEFDEAFLSRMQAVVKFPLPDVACREVLWSTHLNRITKADDVDVAELSRLSTGFAGRDINQACIVAAVLARNGGRNCMRRCDLMAAIEFVAPRLIPSTAAPRLCMDDLIKTLRAN